MRPGAYLLGAPADTAEPHNGTFWKSLPGGPGLFWPMFIVALLAAIVASQALISAVFQIGYQAIAQGFFPRFHVYHKSREKKGQVGHLLLVWQAPLICLYAPTQVTNKAATPMSMQVYIPIICWMLFALCILVVCIFQTSDRLGAAYGASTALFTPIIMLQRTGTTRPASSP